MKSVFGINFFIFCILSLTIILYYTHEICDEGSDEGFDNTGALTQLDSTRVISKREHDIHDRIYDNLTRQGIINMTESGYKSSDYANVRNMY